MAILKPAVTPAVGVSIVSVSVLAFVVIVVPPVPTGFMPMRSLTYPSKILGFYFPYKRFMKSWPRPDRYKKPDHDSLFFAAETLILSDPLLLGLK